MPTKPALSPRALSVGVDGCAGGWFAVARRGRAPVFAGLFDSFADLVERLHDAERCLVDIPIGLPAQGQRDCDRAARQRLPATRRSCVFPVPIREAVYAPDYATACQLSFARTAKRISRQSWNICSKIREVDTLLRRRRELGGQILESHPELCFGVLAGQHTLAAKKTLRGQDQRLALLGELWPAAGELYERALSAYPRKRLARDDILDAMVLAVAAPQRLRGVGAANAFDADGLPMQIWYAARAR